MASRCSRKIRSRYAGKRTVRTNRRVIFRFAEGQAEDVDLVDYH